MVHQHHPSEYLQGSGYPHAAITVKSISRPVWMWAIAYFDIIKAFTYLGLIGYHMYLFWPVPRDVESLHSTLHYILALFGIITGFLQGVILRSGLKKDDDYVTLFYCKAWLVFQSAFLAGGLVFMVVAVIWLINQSEPLFKVGILFGCSVYPFFNYYFVNCYKRKLKLNINNARVRSQS